jgi:hypothetical protein
LAAIPNSLSLPPVLKQTLFLRLQTESSLEKNFDSKNTRRIFAVRSKKSSSSLTTWDIQPG